MDRPQKYYRTINQDALSLISQVLDRHTKAVVEESTKGTKIRNTSDCAALRERVAALEEALRECYHELNEIHARDGTPYTHAGYKSGVSQEYFTSVVEKARAVLKDSHD